MVQTECQQKRNASSNIHSENGLKKKINVLAKKMSHLFYNFFHRMSFFCKWSFRQFLFCCIFWSPTFSLKRWENRTLKVLFQFFCSFKFSNTMTNQISSICVPMIQMAEYVDGSSSVNRINKSKLSPVNRRV